MIYQTTQDHPEMVYFAVVVTVDADGNHVENYSRPYMKRTTARMRATTLARQNVDVVDWWVLRYYLNDGGVDRGDS